MEEKNLQSTEAKPSLESQEQWQSSGEVTVTTNRDILADSGYEESIIFTDEYDDAIIGIDAVNERVIYDYNKMVDALVKKWKFTPEEEAEWIECNEIGSLSGMDDGPIVMYTIEGYK